MIYDSIKISYIKFKNLREHKNTFLIYENISDQFLI